jgi:XTP/dITP diphosphohydrolase
MSLRSTDFESVVSAIPPSRLICPISTIFLWKVKLILVYFPSMKLVIATKNRHKYLEIREFFQDRDEVLYLADFPDIPEVQETGMTFLENSLLKARSIYRKLKIPVMADDSGLEVNSLSGAPGIWSRRYAGERATDRDRVRKLLRNMRGVPRAERGARFVCAMAFVSGRRELAVTGYCHGFISPSPRGSRGFGYDPVFYCPDLGKTLAELPLEEKNVISHRSNAVKRMRSLLGTEHES